ncbi:hypothetical protein [Senegalia massiliensis]|uniref:hypothetical protein n=1 Tax=Senegalia massiliensis TaxID=1720316 RepID=UPI0010306870|nr:hypothetical protein [Senegalia massiliensis]
MKKTTLLNILLMIIAIAIIGTGLKINRTKANEIANAKSQKDEKRLQEEQIEDEIYEDDLNIDIEIDTVASDDLTELLGESYIKLKEEYLEIYHRKKQIEMEELEEEEQEDEDQQVYEPLQEPSRPTSPLSPRPSRPSGNDDKEDNTDYEKDSEQKEDPTYENNQESDVEEKSTETDAYNDSEATEEGQPHNEEHENLEPSGDTSYTEDMQ